MRLEAWQQVACPGTRGASNISAAAAAARAALQRGRQIAAINTNLQAAGLQEIATLLHLLRIKKLAAQV